MVRKAEPQTRTKVPLDYVCWKSIMLTSQRVALKRADAKKALNQESVMKFELIISYNGGQEFTYPVYRGQGFPPAQWFYKQAAKVSEFWYKVSACLDARGVDAASIPAWYTDCDGKFWREDILVQEAAEKLAKRYPGCKLDWTKDDSDKKVSPVHTVAITLRGESKPTFGAKVGGDIANFGFIVTWPTGAPSGKWCKKLVSQL